MSLCLLFLRWQIRKPFLFGRVLSPYMEFVFIAGPSSQPGLLASVPQPKAQPTPSQPLQQSQPKQSQAPSTPQQTSSTQTQGLPTQAQATPQHQQQLLLKQQQQQQQQPQQQAAPQQPTGTFYQQQQQQAQTQQVRRSMWSLLCIVELFLLEDLLGTCIFLGKCLGSWDLLISASSLLIDVETEVPMCKLITLRPFSVVLKLWGVYSSSLVPSMKELLSKEIQ